MLDFITSNLENFQEIISMKYKIIKNRLNNSFHNLLLVVILSAYYTPTPKYKIDNQLGTKHAISRIMIQDQLIIGSIKNTEY